MPQEEAILQQAPHRRLNPLTGEWILVSPHRTQRPWQGQMERTPGPAPAIYDPACYLCPGNSRAGGARNPQYEATFVFDNDFAALRTDTPSFSLERGGLLVAGAERGVCRVVCFSPNHGLTLARMEPEAIRLVVDTWREQFLELGAMETIRYVQVFENRGEMMGASNPHPHCQIWATETLPNELAKEESRQRAWLETTGRCLLCDYVAIERSAGARLVCENDAFTVLVPFWAVWPFETIVLAKRHVNGLDELTAQERSGLAGILKRLATRYDNLFETSFPYSMGFHQRPSDGAPYPHVHLHAHFYPPLLRSATVRKFMVGFELLALPQRDITPETAAARLRELSESHYLAK